MGVVLTFKTKTFLTLDAPVTVNLGTSNALTFETHILTMVDGSGNVHIKPGQTVSGPGVPAGTEVRCGPL